MGVCSVDDLLVSVSGRRRATPAAKRHCTNTTYTGNLQVSAGLHVPCHELLSYLCLLENPHCAG